METDLVSIEKQNMKTISNCWRRVIGRFWLNRFNRAVMLVPVGLWLQKYINVRTKNEKVFNLIMFFGLALILSFYIFETVWRFK
jgi:hypothetical protein